MLPSLYIGILRPVYVWKIGAVTSDSLTPAWYTTSIADVFSLFLMFSVVSDISIRFFWESFTLDNSSSISTPYEEVEVLQALPTNLTNNTIL